MEDDTRGKCFQVDYDAQTNTTCCPRCTEDVEMDEELCPNCGILLDWRNTR